MAAMAAEARKVAFNRLVGLVLRYTEKIDRGQMSPFLGLNFHNVFIRESRAGPRESKSRIVFSFKYNKQTVHHSTAYLLQQIIEYMNEREKKLKLFGYQLDTKIFEREHQIIQKKYKQGAPIDRGAYG